MGLALTLQPGRHWLTPLLVFLGARVVTQPAANDDASRNPRVVRPRVTPVAQPAALRSHRPHRAAPPRLRVVSVADGTSRPGLAGRMVISGRLADVCAELERLEALGHDGSRSR